MNPENKQISSPPLGLYTAEQTRELENEAIETHHISASTLMRRAGHAALNEIQQHWPKAKHLLILSGIGNNGGDGYELARQALAKGYQVDIIQVGDPSKSSRTAQAARDTLLEMGTKLSSFKGELPKADIYVDALFGTGLTRDISGEFKTTIDAVNSNNQTPVLSLDCPSGLDVDKGKVLGVAIKASRTISFLGLNPGLFTGSGPDYCGDIGFDSLAIPPDIYANSKPFASRLSLQNESHWLAPRDRSAHKGRYGHTLVIGGNQGMSGAVRLAAEGAARVGSGLTSIATRAVHASLLNLNRPELMCHTVEQADDLEPLLSIANVITIGPGLGQDTWGESLLNKVLETESPLVIDADGLNILSTMTKHNDHWILTPHPGEAARLLNCSSNEVQADRFSAVRKIQETYGGVVVLKGAGTLVYDGNSPVHLSSDGNPGMSSGGMGDVLAGVISGLVAQGLPLMSAACVGVTIHAMAADRAAEKDGERGMLALDLMPHIRHLANLIMQ